MTGPLLRGRRDLGADRCVHPSGVTRPDPPTSPGSTARARPRPHSSAGPPAARSAVPGTAQGPTTATGPLRTRLCGPPVPRRLPGVGAADRPGHGRLLPRRPAGSVPLRTAGRGRGTARRPGAVDRSGPCPVRRDDPQDRRAGAGSGDPDGAAAVRRRHRADHVPQQWPPARPASGRDSAGHGSRGARVRRRRLPGPRPASDGPRLRTPLVRARCARGGVRDPRSRGRWHRRVCCAGNWICHPAPNAPSNCASAWKETGAAREALRSTTGSPVTPVSPAPARDRWPRGRVATGHRVPGRRPGWSATTIGPTRSWRAASTISTAC